MRSTIERSVTAVYPLAQVRPGERVMGTGASGGLVGRPAKRHHGPYSPAETMLPSDLSEETISGKIRRAERWCPEARLPADR